MSSVASLASTSSSLSTSGGNVSSNKPSSASSSSSTAVATAQTLSASGGSAAPEPDPIQFSSARELELELASILTLFKGKETEQNWEAREQAFQKLRGVFRGLNVDGNVMMLDSFVSANGIVRELHEVLVKSVKIKKERRRRWIV